MPPHSQHEVVATCNLFQADGRPSLVEQFPVEMHVKNKRLRKSQPEFVDSLIEDINLKGTI